MSKTYNNLFERIVDFENIWHAYLEARAGKRYRREVACFAVNLEENFINLQNHLLWGSWAPGHARQFSVFEPKRRDIQAPPFTDRIVHHALVRVVEPLFEQKFIRHSYACRKGKGAQRAVRALQGMLCAAQCRWSSPYVVKADIKSFFASIRHNILLRLIQRTISCRQTLALWQTILSGYGHEAGVGLPVGALTSQLGANIILDSLDHVLTDTLGWGRYVRYMDDFIMVAPNKPVAWSMLEAIGREVAGLGLALNPKTRLFPTKCGVDFCGYRIWATHILPRKRNIKKARQRFKVMVQQFTRGEIDLDYVKQRVASFLAYTKHCSAQTTVAGILRETIFSKESV